MDEPDLVQERITKHLHTHFQQAQGTPFTTKPLSDDINYVGDTEAAESILEGNYQNEKVTNLTNLFLQQMKRRTNNTIPDIITKEEMMTKYKLWREQTTTSPSGRHLGHYKALIGKHTYDKNSEGAQTFEEKQQQIINVHHSMLNYAIKHGYSYCRWKQVENFTLEKDAGSPKLH